MLIFATMINDVDDRAFMQEVYQQNERLMYAIALKYASNTQDCEDIVHDTVERLCKNIIKIKGLPNSALRAYVVYAVRNTAINFRKHQATINRHIQQLSDDDLSSEYDQPESIIERIEDLQEKRTSLTKVWTQLMPNKNCYTGNMFWIKQQKNSQEFFSAAETVSGCAFHAQGENL